MKSLERLSRPSLETAREFFNWEIQKLPIFDADGNQIEGYTQFKSTKGNTLHVGNETYSPAQPGAAFEKSVEALNEMKLDFGLFGVGSFHDDANIFAQFEIKGADGYSSSFEVDGKKYQGLVTMGKGNDESFPLSYWLTLIGIFCGNTWRAAAKARKGNAQSLTMKQTKNSEARFNVIQNEIVALFSEQKKVEEKLKQISRIPVKMDEAKNAFLGLIGSIDTDLSKAGRTRLQNSLDRYMDAFKNSPGASGKTREDWFNAVTFVDTHGNRDAKKFDANKQFISSEFGTYAERKENAFEIVSSDRWGNLVSLGEKATKKLENIIVIPEFAVN